MYPGFSAMTSREPAQSIDHSGWGAPFIISIIAEQMMCVRRMVAECHTITERIGSREAAGNQSRCLPLSPCGLRFKLDPIYAVTKMDTVSFMQEVGITAPPPTSPHTHCSWQISGAKQSCVVQTALLQTQRPPSSRKEANRAGDVWLSEWHAIAFTTSHAMNWAQTKIAKGTSRSNNAFQIREWNSSQEMVPPLYWCT